MINSEGFISNAVNFCLTHSKGYSNTMDIIRQLTTHNNNLHSKFRYSIAKDITKFLHDTFSDHIIAVKLYGSTMEYTAGVYSDIDIIVHVRMITERLSETLKLLNAELSEKYYVLIGKAPDEWSYLIDAHILNDDPREKTPPSHAYLEHLLHNGSIDIS